MTIKIYEADVYKREHQAQIIELIKDENISVILDETIFFPVGGGQTADKGTLNGIKVLNVLEKEGKIIHILEAEPKTKAAVLKIDWDNRFDQMQQHCGEHILSGVIKSAYDGNNKGFHLGEDYVTVDIDLKNMTKAMIDHIEELSNDAIHKDIELKISKVEDANQAVDFPVRKDLTVDEDIRVVTIPDIDCVACCGTHPNRTGEVGIIKIYKTEKNKGMTRIFFKCGNRAIRDLRVKTDLINQLNQMYSSDDATLLARIQSEKEKNESLKKAYVKLNRQNIDRQISNEIHSDHKFVHLIFDHLSSNDMHYVIKKITDNKSAITLLYSKSESKVILSHDGSEDLDCGQLFKSIRAYEGKGGGNSKVAQGVFTNNEAGLKFLDYLIENIKE